MVNLEDFKNKEYEPFFTKEEAELLGLSEAEAKEFDIAQTIIDMAELLPEDENKFAEKFEKEIPDDVNDGIVKMAKLAETDDEFVSQIYALIDLASLVKEVPPPTVSKLSADEINKIAAQEVVDSIIG